MRQELGIPFEVDRGVLEGDILSPLLFILGLEVAFRDAGDDACAPMLGDIPVPQLAFADDAIMLSIGVLQEVQDRFDNVRVRLAQSGLFFSKKKGKCALLYGGSAQEVRKPNPEDIVKLKPKYACSYCGDRRFLNRADKIQHETTCDLGRDILHPDRFEVDAILDVRGPPSRRFYLVEWAPGQLGALQTWEPHRNLGEFCKGSILRWFDDHPQWHYLDNVEVEGEIRCARCNKRDFDSEQQLKRHQKQAHTPPAIAGTLAYKKAQTAIQQEAHDGLPKLNIDDHECSNLWRFKWLGTIIQGDGVQHAAVQQQCNVMFVKFYELQH